MGQNHNTSFAEIQTKYQVSVFSIFCHTDILNSVQAPDGLNSCVQLSVYEICCQMESISSHPDLFSNVLLTLLNIL